MECVVICEGGVKSGCEAKVKVDEVEDELSSVIQANSIPYS